MRAIGVFLSSLVLVGILSGIVWYARYSGDMTPAEIAKMEKYKHETERAREERLASEAALKPPPDSEPAPPISATGPYPKAVMDELLFEFDTMAVNEERSHVFTIRNEGEAPLLLSKGDTSCKCTISGLSKKELAPGETAEINLVWIPRDLDPHFGKEAIIQSNDPDHPRIKFQIKGKVVQKYLVTPSFEWVMGTIPEGETGETVGFITSQLYENFKILGIDSDQPLLTIESTPLSEEELKKFESRSGYQFKAVLSQGIPVGPFNGKVKVRTDIDGETIIDVRVRALRPGPLRFLPAIGGAHWNREQMSLNMGRITAAEGKTVYLPLFVSGMEEDFKLMGAESNVDILKVSLDSDGNNQTGKQKTYRLKFEYPPGKPAMSRTSNDPCRVKLKTNHPAAEEFEVEVLFISL